MNRKLLEPGQTTAQVSAAYGLTLASLKRHKANHLKLSTSLVSEAKNALTVVGFASDLYERATRIADRAERYLEAVDQEDVTSRSVQAAAAALRELRGSIELLAKLVVTAPPEEQEQGNSWLDAALTEAVAGLVMAELPPGTSEVVDAQIIQAPE